MLAPARAVCPLPPRPPVLPMPEPMPRPMRMRFLRAPGLSAIWLSFMSLILTSHVSVLSRGMVCLMRDGRPSPAETSFCFADHFHQMLDFADHSADRRRIGEISHAPDLVQAKPDQRGALEVVPPLRAAHLFNFDRLCRSHRQIPQSAVASASVSRRRDCRVDTLMLRRAATQRGGSWCLSAAQGGPTNLY